MGKNNVNLYIFTPYEWDYCGGAIIVIASSYEAAIDMIIEEDYHRAVKSANITRWDQGDKSDAEFVDMFKTYKREYFSNTPDVFRKSHWDQWLLTSTIKVSDNEKPRIVEDNWNHA